MKKIILLCNAGMSTSLLVNKMREAAKIMDEDCDIHAYPISEARERSKGADIVLLGPQVRFELNKVKGQVECPVDVIDMMAYGMVDGKKALQQALKGIK